MPALGYLFWVNAETGSNPPLLLLIYAAIFEIEGRARV